MTANQQNTNHTQSSNPIILPRLLKRYRDSEYYVQIKVRFLYYLYLICLASVITHLMITMGDILMGTQIIAHTVVNIVMKLVTAALTVLFIQLLIKGHYTLSSHLLAVTLQIQIWFSIFLNGNEAFLQVSLIVHIITILSMIPIIADKRRNSILLYFIANIIMVGFATLYFGQELRLNPIEQMEFFLTTVTAILFLAYVSYNIFIINQSSLQRVKEELNERMNVEQALVISEKKYREMVDFLPLSIFEITDDGTLIYANKACLRMFGYHETPMPEGFNFLNIIVPEERNLMIKNATSFFDNNVNSNYQYTALRKNGTTFPIQFTSSIIYEHGKIKGLRGVGFDLTAQKKADESIKESLQLFQTLIEFAPVPIFLANDKGHFLMVNNAFCEQTGYHYEDITFDTGIRTSSLIPAHNQITIDEQLKAKGQVNNLEIRTSKKDKEPLDILYYVKKLIIKGKEVYLSTFNNITEKKKAELELEFYSDQLEILVIERTEELALSIEELRISNENLNTQRAELEQTLQELKNTENQLLLADKMASLGLLAAGIAHEINNPLNFIKGGIYGLESFFSDNLTTEKQEEALPLILAIDKGIDRAADIVKSLNRFSRQTQNKSEECDLHAIIDDCLILMESQLKNRISVSRHYNAQKHKFLYNEGRVNQAILNLLTNASQAIEKEGKIAIHTYNEKKLLILSIQDDGCGIEQQNLKNIFDPFFTTKEPGKGTGLGLSITFQIIEEINGTIEYKSKPGEGTTVMVKIPLKTADND